MAQTLHEYFGFSKTPFGKDLSRQELFIYPQVSKAIERHISVSGKELVFVVDEAHLLDRSTLEDLRLLSNSGMDRRSMVSIILLGQIWLRDRLKYREYEALNQRLRLRYSLEGLSEAETGQYIEHHLKLVGCSKDLFASEAVKQIFIPSGGIPRPINNLCVASLLKAMLTKKKTVDGSLVKRVAREQAMA